MVAVPESLQGQVDLEQLEAELKVGALPSLGQSKPC